MTSVESISAAREAAPEVVAGEVAGKPVDKVWAEPQIWHPPLKPGSYVPGTKPVCVESVPMQEGNGVCHGWHGQNLEQNISIFGQNLNFFGIFFKNIHRFSVMSPNRNPFRGDC